MRAEPVRGGLPDPGFYSLTGFEQADALRRGLVHRSPLAHLIGLAVTQASPGTATLTMPASPWLEWGDGLDVGILAEAALSTAVLSGAPGGTDVRTAVMSITPFRSATLDAAKLIAHGRTIRRSRAFTYAEAVVQDDLGRELARATGAVAVRPMDPPPPAAPPLPAPLEEPVYPSPDPHLRPLPPGAGPIPRTVLETQDAPGLVRTMVGGGHVVPIIEFLDLTGLEGEAGWARMNLRVTEWFCHRDRTVAPGVLGRLLAQVLNTASWVVPLGSRVGVVNASFNFLRPVPPDGRELVAEARVTEHHDDVIVTSATVTDTSGSTVATAFQTAVCLPLRPRPPARAEPVVATVLFTDLVGSTAEAHRLGDERWRELLREHDDDVRRQLQTFTGREIKTTGDGFLATFESPARAVRCARAIRDAVRRLGLDVRAGAHTGECEFADGDVTGIAVHLAARVLDTAAPGEVLVSSTVRDLVLGSGLRFDDRGRHQLKGIDGDWQLFALED